MLIYKKCYKKRKNVIYEIFNRKSGKKIKMVRCYCGKRFKFQENNLVCPKCKEKITKESVVFLDIGEFKLFNFSTYMFLDKKDNGDILLTLSMLLLTVDRKKFTFYPILGKDAISLKIRFNLSKKTALMYMNKTRCDEELWDTYKLPTKFVNFTQPTSYYLANNVDIKLPNEFVCDFCDFIGVDVYNREVTLSDLAWLNRLRDFDEAMRWKEILTKLSEEYKDISVLKEERLYYKKTVNRIKRYLKTGYKPKNFDEKTFDALCKTYSIERNLIPKEFEKYYYLNSKAISFVREHNLLFKNRDIRINTILSATKGYRINMNYHNSNLLNNFRDKALEAFGKKITLTSKNITKTKYVPDKNSEWRIFKKVEENEDYIAFYDTVNMILKIRNEGYEIKTKGNLYNLHDKAAKMIRLIDAPDVVFKNTKGISDIIYKNENEEYTFIFAKTPRELIELGDNMKICVGSYYNSCINNNMIIIYIKKKNEFLACLEINLTKDDNGNIIPTLFQAKGILNSYLSIKIQKLISNFLLDYSVKIETCDINHNISTIHNDKIDKGLGNKKIKFKYNELSLICNNCNLNNNAILEDVPF